MHSAIVKSVSLALFLSLTPIALANEGAGSSGGGQGAQSPDGVELRELVTGSICDWKEGQSFFAGLEHFRRIEFFFHFLFPDPDMIRPLEREILRVRVCLSSSPLRTLPESVTQAVAVYPPKGFPIDTKLIQVAIRIGNEIYIDRAAFEAMKPMSQAYLGLHELFHSFISPTATARMTRLRDFVAGFHALDQELPTPTIQVTQQFLFDATPENQKKLREIQHRYRRLLIDNSVRNSWQLTPEELIPLVHRHALDGRVSNVYRLFREGVTASHRTANGASLLLNLILELETCHPDDDRSDCQESRRLVEAYLTTGQGDANARVLVETPGGDPLELPIWSYLLRKAANYRPKQVRLALARQLFEAATRLGVSKEDQTQLDSVLMYVSNLKFQWEVLREVVALGAGINHQDEKGQTPLMRSVSWPNWCWKPFPQWQSPPFYIPALLIALGADGSLTDTSGQTAADLFAAEYKDLKGCKPDYVRSVEMTGRLLTEGPKALPQAATLASELGFPALLRP